MRMDMMRSILSLTVLCLCTRIHAAGTPRFLVEHNTGDMTTAIQAKVDAAMAANGVVEFEAGKVYRTKTIYLWKDRSTGTERMLAGIEGNSATLKWVQDSSTGNGLSLLYLWEPQFKGNSGLYIRNPTLDAGNNDIPSYSTRLEEDLDEQGGAGLVGGGATGQLYPNDSACAYGLRIFGAQDFLIENVTILRAATAGVYVQGTASWPVRNAVFRNVTARYGATDGFVFDNTDSSPNVQMSNITLENCYAHFNLGNAFYFEYVDPVRMIGCGGEKNGGWQIKQGAGVGLFEVFGGYTEKSDYDHLSPPTPYADEQGIQIHSDTDSVRIFGGRLFGRFEYTYSSDDMAIHSYGHTHQGFDSTKVPQDVTVSPAEANYVRTSEQNDLRHDVNPAYYEIPNYYRYYPGIDINGTACSTKAAWRSALLSNYNIVMVEHDGTADQTDEIEDAIDDAVNSVTVDGISRMLAFEPGMVYRCSAVAFNGVISGGNRGSIIGIDGNNATLLASDSGSAGEPFVNLENCFTSHNAEDYHHGFWIRDLNIDAALGYDVALKITNCRFFSIRNVDVTGAKQTGVLLEGIRDGSDEKALYYGTFNELRSHHNGNSSNTADGIDILAIDSTGVMFANVGFYGCRSEFNTGRGIHLKKAYVLVEGSVVRGNLGHGIEAGLSRSFDVIDTRITGTGYGSSKEVYLLKAADTYIP